MNDARSVTVERVECFDILIEIYPHGTNNATQYSEVCSEIEKQNVSHLKDTVTAEKSLDALLCDETSLNEK